jgi:capsular polysaccharide biosynthesis protein
MNVWLHSLKEIFKIKIDILDTEQFLTKALKTKDVVIFNDYDKVDLFAKNKINILLNKLRNFYRVDHFTNKEDNIIILTRNFAKNNVSVYTKTSKVSRFMENIEELYNEILKTNKCKLVDTSEDEYKDVLECYTKSNIMIGQWGAGLTNMIWMPRNSTIVEITAKEIEIDSEWKDCYKYLAKSLGHKFVSIQAQETWDGPVDINKILELIKN